MKKRTLPLTPAVQTFLDAADVLQNSILAEKKKGLKCSVWNEVLFALPYITAILRELIAKGELK